MWGGPGADNATYENLLEASRWPAWVKYDLQVPDSYEQFHNESLLAGTNWFVNNSICRANVTWCPAYGTQSRNVNGLMCVANASHDAGVFEGNVKMCRTSLV